VQTTFFKDDGKWIRFGAYGFTFSSPTLKIKLFEVGATDSSKSTVQEEVVILPKKVVAKSISCIKGKISKKVSGVNPKCPSGFKKK
jgi:hypothetical protein